MSTNPNNNTSNRLLHVVLNDKVVLEFDREKPLPDEQLQYLDNMDSRMNEGVQLGDEFVKSLNPLQKAQFVANSMVNGLLNDEDNQAIAMCTYLGNRLADLKQVICTGKDDATGIQIEFVYDKDYVNEKEPPQEQTIKFFDPKDFVKQ